MKTIEIINAEIECGAVAPLVAIYDFLKLATAENLEALFAQASPRLKHYLVDHAICNRENFDRVIAGFGDHEDPSHWIAYRDWALRHREVLEAPRPTGTFTAGTARTLQDRLHDQGALIAENRVAFMRAQTQEERDRLDEARQALEERFARENADWTK